MFSKYTCRVLIILLASFMKGSICQIPDPECYAVDDQYFVEIPVSVYEETGSTNGFKTSEAKTRCRGYCHTPGKALYYGVKRLGHFTSRARCYCAYTLPDATTTGCSYKCPTACGGVNRISVYQVCPTNCKDNNCQVTGNTCFGCINGYYGDFCDQTCPENCGSDRCQQTSGVCDGCEDGYYGNSCDNQCPGSCINNNCEQYHCTYGCVPGYYNDLCLRWCPANCKDGLCDRVSGDCMQCEGDFYGNKCNIICPTNCEGQCYQSTGNCPACHGGWYGERCDKQCPSNCRNNVCDQNDETCTNGCDDGWYGDLCNRLCPPTCKEKCERGSGDCTNGCADGFYGTRCNMNCSTNCVSLTCNQSTGSCTQGCVDMWYGDSCQEPCSTNCDATCDRNSGECSSGCVDGFYGERCERNCSIQCEPSSCKQENGSCSHGCTSGYFGNKCQQLCPSQCAAGLCDFAEGTCTNGCIQWYSGPKCEMLVCPTNCLNADCDGSDGNCLQGCVDGYHGDRCDDICPANCEELSCTRGGLCVGGCKQGWYGPRCAESCPSNCVSPSCDKETGACIDGCQKGWTAQTGVLSVGEIVGVSITVVAVLGVAIAVSVIFLLRRKKRRASKQPDNHVPFTDVTSSPTATSFTSEPIYENETVEANVDILLHYLKNRTPGILLAEFKELQGNNAGRIPGRTEASIAKYQTRGCCYLMMSLPSTHEALWRLIRENQCDTVVTLLTAQQAENAPYLVTVKDDKSGDYEKLSTNKPGIQTDFRIIKAPPGLISGSPEYANIIADTKNQVGVFSITMEENMECLDPKSTIELSKEIHAWCHQQRIVEPHILVICFDGVRHSGQLVAMCGLFEMISETKNVDVLRCAKKLKSIRPGFIGSMEQYLNLYEACRQYIEAETNTYATIQH